MALLAGPAGARSVLGDADVADIGVSDTCAINHQALVSQMEKQHSAALHGAAHLAWLGSLFCHKSRGWLVVHREPRQRRGMGSGGGTGLPFTAPEVLAWQGRREGASSFQGRL